MEIDEKLLKRINRQLRGIRIMLGLFFLMFIGMLAILGFIAFKVITFTQEVNTKIQNIQQTTQEQLDVKSQLCDNTSSYLTAQLCSSATN